MKAIVSQRQMEDAFLLLWSRCSHAEAEDLGNPFTEKPLDASATQRHPGRDVTLSPESQQPTRPETPMSLKLNSRRELFFCFFFPRRH